MSLCIVTAFLDIGRQNWSTFQRSIVQYFNNFLPYTRFSNEIIVFIDDTHVDILRKLCSKSNNIKIIPINRQWMKDNIHGYKYLDKEDEIMKSTKFQELIRHRIHHPECSKPEYNIMQHCKIDFVCYVINNNMSQSKYYAWSDFGYFQIPNRIPERPLDLNKFDLNRVNFQAINNLTSQDADIMYTLTKAPERIGGFFYLGNIPALLKYQELYHKICQDFYNIGIVDDDQHIMIQSVFREPDLFKVWNLGGWHLVYNYFQASK